MSRFKGQIWQNIIKFKALLLFINVSKLTKKVLDNFFNSLMLFAKPVAQQVKQKTAPNLPKTFKSKLLWILDICTKYKAVRTSISTYEEIIKSFKDIFDSWQEKIIEPELNQKTK